MTLGNLKGNQRLKLLLAALGILWGGRFLIPYVGDLRARLKIEADHVLNEAQSLRAAITAADRIKMSLQSAAVVDSQLSRRILMIPESGDIGAVLLSETREMAERSGLAINDLRVAPGPENGNERHFVTVLVVGNATGDALNLGEFVAAVEGSVPELFLRDLTVTQPEPNRAAPRREQLTIDFTISAITYRQSNRP